ncbi:putative bifunctional diguanylate cyclase/phosphodiesterase [Thiomicrorhabdus cannonii]|uniref:putative bifunctional diguanylate cyclase/phosphodiesterase n=1 Tax=Thiomicrorhabdus cannonii TaxID=2748011 RepID=UPI0015BBB303|nr:diguanylate cyclase [Thiomicrorhabdus cannonii]
MLELETSKQAESLHDAGALREKGTMEAKKLVKRRLPEKRTDIKQVMESLQSRFSHTDDMPEDIARLVEAQVQLRTRDLFVQANYDALTHLPNRAYFSETLEKVLERAQKAHSKFSLLFLDLDGFKEVNDTLGHQAGDELLQHVAARLVSSVREGDIVSRRGGDEFVILLTDLASREDIASLCQRIIREVSRPYWLSQHEANVSTSMGVAIYPQDGKTVSELLENSDAALYASKTAGRRTYRFYTEIMNEVGLKSHEFREELGVAIENGEIELSFEPQVELATGQIAGASLTALWHNAHLESPALSSWSNILLKSGWSQSMATWLLDSALYYLQRWQSAQSDLVVSVPVLDSLWLHQDLPAFLDTRLQAYHVSREQLQLEFSMASLQSGDSKLQQTLQALGEAGYLITLTDVGAYPLDLALLSTLKINEIKLDKAWLQQSLQTKSGQAWLQALIMMAKSLDICVIAAGVDSAEQSRQLRTMGCLMAQGSQWAKPMSAERFHNHVMALYRVRA